MSSPTSWANLHPWLQGLTYCKNWDILKSLTRLNVPKQQPGKPKISVKLFLWLTQSIANITSPSFKDKVKHIMLSVFYSIEVYYKEEKKNLTSGENQISIIFYLWFALLAKEWALFSHLKHFPLCCCGMSMTCTSTSFWQQGLICNK